MKMEDLKIVFKNIRHAVDVLEKELEAREEECRRLAEMIDKKRKELK